MTPDSQRDADVGVEHRGQHVHRDERHGQQREVPVQAGHGEAGQAGQAALAVDQDAEHQDGGEQQQRHDAGGAAGVPEHGGPAHLSASRPCVCFSLSVIGGLRSAVAGS